jgi:hypothetical protein
LLQNKENGFIAFWDEMRNFLILARDLTVLTLINESVRYADVMCLSGLDFAAGKDAL